MHSDFAAGTFTRFMLCTVFIPFIFSLSIARAADLDYQGRDESYWRQRADSLRQQLEEHQVRYESVNNQELACANRPSRSGSLARECASTYRPQKLAIERQLDLVRKKLEDELPEEARKAGAYPGWLR